MKVSAASLRGETGLMMCAAGASHVRTAVRAGSHGTGSAAHMTVMHHAAHCVRAKRTLFLRPHERQQRGSTGNRHRDQQGQYILCAGHLNEYDAPGGLIGSMICAAPGGVACWFEHSDRRETSGCKASCYC